jgi:hypothetical protein
MHCSIVKSTRRRADSHAAAETGIAPHVKSLAGIHAQLVAGEGMTAKMPEKPMA